MKAVAALLLLLCAGCLGRTVYVCEDSDACGPDGTCQAGGFCSFPDQDCDSGQRWGELSGDGLAGSCVGVAVGQDAAAPIDAEPGPAWWDPGWTRRIRITIHNVATDTLDDGHEVAVPIDVDALLGGDAEAALRVMAHDDDRWQQRPRFIERSGAATELLWTSLGIDLLPGESRELWLYYDSDAITGALDDPDQLFLLYDSFAVFNDLDWDWSGASPPPSSDGAILTLLGGHAIWSYERFFAGRAVDAALRIPSWGESLDLGWFFNEGGAGGDYAQVDWESHPAGTMTPHYEHSSTGAGFDGPPTAATTGWHVWTVERGLTGARFTLDGVPRHQQVYGEQLDPFDGMAPVIDNDPSSSVQVDWLRVRRWVDPPPTVELGVAQTMP